MDWFLWHDGYGPGGQMHERLRVVQGQVRDALVAAPPGKVRVVSVCAGQGLDVIEAVTGSARRHDVRARLVELDERNVDVARRCTADAGLTGGVEVQHGDAGTTDAYVGAVPADVVLLCGVFGSLTDDDIETTVGALPELCAQRAQVVWTAHKAASGLYEQAYAAFERHGFAPVWTDPTDPFGVTRHHFVGQPRQLQVGKRLFGFADEQTLADLGRL